MTEIKISLLLILAGIYLLKYAWGVNREVGGVSMWERLIGLFFIVAGLVSLFIVMSIELGNIFIVLVPLFYIMVFLGVSKKWEKARKRPMYKAVAEFISQMEQGRPANKRINKI